MYPIIKHMLEVGFACSRMMSLTCPSQAAIVLQYSPNLCLNPSRRAGLAVSTRTRPARPARPARGRAFVTQRSHTWQDLDFSHGVHRRCMVACHLRSELTILGDDNHLITAAAMLKLCGLSKAAWLLTCQTSHLNSAAASRPHLKRSMPTSRQSAQRLFVDPWLHHLRPKVGVPRFVPEAGNRRSRRSKFQGGSQAGNAKLSTNDKTY